MDADPILPTLYMGGHRQPRSAAPPYDLRVLCAKELPRDDDHQAHKLIRLYLDDTGAFLTPKEVERTREGACLVAVAIAQGKRVLVSCAMGRNRSGLVCARALIFLGYEPRKAINAVRARRRWVDGVPALENRAFTRWLMGEHP